jgi:hypothetical protein
MTEQEVKPCEFANGACVNCEATERGDCQGWICPPKRPWRGLTDEDFLEACQLAERGNYLVAFQQIQIKLKERNK